MAKIIAIDINDVIRDNISQYIKYYAKAFDSDFEMEYEDMTDYDFSRVLPFESKEEFNEFKYVDYPYELCGRAELTTENLAKHLNTWLMTTLADTEEDVEVIYFSPMEMGLTIQSTLSFLARIGTRVREIIFPKDSLTMWDRCDIMITANPNLLDAQPANKTAIKIKTPYNKDIDCEYEFDNLESLIKDENNIIVKIIEDNE